MKTFTTTILALASAAFAVAQTCNGINCFNVPAGGYQTSAGSTVNITWTPSTSGTISLQLRDGNSAYLNNGTYIVQGIQNSGQYTWNVPKDIIRGNSYAIEIISDSDPTKVNYTPQFNIDSTVLYASTSAAASSAASTSAATSGASTSGSASASVTASGSMTTSMSTTMTASTTGSATASTTSSRVTLSSGLASRATAAAGLIGVIAFGALAL